MELWFEFLDVDGDKSVSAEELEDPLVSLGLARNREEAEKLVSMYDQDGDMELDFNEFQKLQQIFWEVIPLVFTQNACCQVWILSAQ